MCCGHRTRSARGARLRARCGLLTSCGLRMRCTLRMNCRLRMILIRASHSRPVRGGLILIRTSRSRPVFGGLILIRASRSRLVRGCLILIRTSRSRFAFGDLILIRVSHSRFVLGGLILVLGCLIRCARLPGRYHPMTAKLRRLRSCSNRRPPVVHGRQECVVATGSVHMLGLHRRWRPVLLVCRGLFCPGRAGVNSTGGAVIADMVHSAVVAHSPVVNIVNVPDVHVVHRAVVVEGSMIPVSAFIADTTVAEAVVDAAVEADMGAPIPLIPSVGVAAPTPVTGSPEKANLGCHHPGTGHPEVAFISISPVAGRPQITFGGGHGLNVHRERGRSDRDRYAELRERGGRYGQYQKS